MKLVKNRISFYFCLIFIGFLIGGICYNYFSGQQGVMIAFKALQASSSFVIILLFPVAERLFKIEINGLLRALLLSFCFFALYLGTLFNFYDLIPSWDLILHFSSGLIFTFIAFVIVRNLFLTDLPKKKNFILSLVVAIFISCTIACLWEIFEFTCDTLFHSNSQRFIPEIEGIYNGGNSSFDLEGTPLEIYEFYKSPAGYRYALMDTMLDMIVCLAGTIFTSFALVFNYKYANDTLIDSLIYKEKETM